MPLPLTPSVFHILLALADEERHGYGIMQDVARQTNDALQLGPGTLYGCLKRMLAAKMVEESEERPDPALTAQRRRMTPLGDSCKQRPPDELQVLHRPLGNVAPHLVCTGPDATPYFEK